jgi:hypothetical protein
MTTMCFLQRSKFRGDSRSTTLPFNNTGPDETSISLFTFRPDDDDLTASFPDESLVFIKVTTSISPGALPVSVPGGALGEGIPVYHTNRHPTAHSSCCNCRGLHCTIVER